MFYQHLNKEVKEITRREFICVEARVKLEERLNC
jgi:hypothetical protein